MTEIKQKNGMPEGSKFFGEKSGRKMKQIDYLGRAFWVRR